MRYDPFSVDVVADPYPFYEELRGSGPVVRLESADLWVVSTYDAVVEVLRDPETFSSEMGMGELLSGELVARSTGARPLRERTERLRLLIASDPPDHTRLRRLVSRAFSPRAISGLEPRVRGICEDLVADLLAAAREGKADLVRHLAYPLPVIVISEMLGVPPERRDDFKRWSDDAVGGLGGTLDPHRARRSLEEMFEFFASVVEERRRRPAGDLISVLVGEDQGETLSATEVLMFCVLLLVAGNETTTNLIANGARACFDHPDQAKLLRDRPDLVPSAVEEALRYDAPVQWLARAATRDTEVAGVEVPAGARLLVLFGSANRDERRYPDPDAFRIDRNPTDHVGFGAGIHFCLGASLARLEARVAAETLLERVRLMTPRGEGARLDSYLLRGFEQLPVGADPC